MTWRDARAAARLLALLPANATPGAGQWAADLARELVAALAGARADRIPPRAAAVAVRAAAARGALTPALLVRLAVAAGRGRKWLKGARARAGARWDAGGILAVARQLRAARGAAAAAGEGGGAAGWGSGARCTRRSRGRWRHCPTRRCATRAMWLRSR